jgi:hypothetical protein
LPKPPSFNEQDISDKPGGIRNLPSLSAAAIADITRRYRCRLESLLAVDEGVKNILGALKDSGELDNTLVIYTSDNGFLLGEHRIKNGKVLPYEEAIRVPLLMRGPGVPQHKSVRDLVANVDWAPTILDAADARAGLRMDGRALFPLMAHRGDRVGRAIEIEAALPRKTFKGVVTQRYMYAEEANAGKELYDFARDPFELRNVEGDGSYSRAEAALSADVARLQACSGSACREHPRAKLRLHYRSGRVEGKRCVRGGLSARVTGAESSIDEVEFSVGGRRVARDTRGPFQGGLGRGHLKRGRQSTVRALLKLTDGRELTVDRKVRGCGR